METDEKDNQRLSEYGKLVKKEEYKNKHDWVDKVIYWELCKKLKFQQTYKWYLHKSESVFENKRHNISWDIEIQTDHPIQARWPDLIFWDPNRSPNPGQMTRPNILRSKQITQSRPDDQI